VVTWRVIVAGLLSLSLVGCGSNSPSRPDKPSPSEDDRKSATVIDYVDSDAFDGLLEAAINRQDSIIVVQTASTKPDWQGRLNAWIAAWNAGGKVQKDEGLWLKNVRIMSEATAPNASKVVVVELPPDTAAEARKLVQGEIDRIERLAREGVDWWKDERTKAKRVESLRPYLFIFEKDANKQYQVIFYK
jgi:hypothetical protein